MDDMSDKRFFFSISKPFVIPCPFGFALGRDALPSARISGLARSSSAHGRQPCQQLAGLLCRVVAEQQVGRFTSTLVPKLRQPGPESCLGFKYSRGPYLCIVP